VRDPAVPGATVNMTPCSDTATVNDPAAVGVIVQKAMAASPDPLSPIT